MRVAITGGTGYVGAHILHGLDLAGFDLRVLVAPHEDPSLVARLAPSGRARVLTGDVRDASVVKSLLDGCDALIHAAGVVGTDDRQADLMWQINAHATEAILRTAVDTGLDPVVLVSSYAALFPSPDPVIGPDSPTATARSAYGQTKAYADGVARELQQSGAPVVVTYPASVVGPALQTAAGVTERGWAPIVRSRIAPVVDGGMQMIDVRDVADAHVAMMTSGRGPRRYILGGQMLTFERMIDLLEHGTGRRFVRIPLPGSVFRTLGRIADTVAGVVPIGGLSYEAAQLLTAATPTDDSLTRTELALTWRSAETAILETFTTASSK